MPSLSDLTLGWSPMGMAAPEVVVPPRAFRGGNYVLAWDPVLQGVVYAVAPAPNQFGHAWLRVEDVWAQTHSTVVHVANVAQDWRGFFDPGRGAVVAWSFSDGTPVGVALTRRGVRLLAPAGVSAFSGAPRDVMTGDIPNIESGWSDLRGVFGYDREAGRTVCVTPGAVHALDTDGVWRRVGPAVDLPTPLGGSAGSYWDTPRARLVFWFWDGRRLHLFALLGNQVVAIDGRGLPIGLGADGFVVGQDERGGALLYMGPDVGAFEPWDEGWRPSGAGRGGPPRQPGGALVVSPSGTVVVGPSADAADDETRFYVRDVLRWRRDGAVIRRSLLHDVRGSGGWPVMACASGRLFAVGWRQDLHTIHWTAAGWRGLVEPVVGTQMHAGHSRENRAAVLEGPGGALHAVFMDGAVFRLDGVRWTVVCGASPKFGPRFDLSAGFDGKSLYVFGGDVGGVDSNDTLRLDSTGWTLLPASPRIPDAHTPQLVFDGGLGRLLRLGSQVALLGDDGVWVPVHVPGYAALASVGFRALARGGEVILLSVGHLYRFDLGGIRPLASIAAPDESHDHVVVHTGSSHPFPLEPDVAFDASGGRLYTCDRHNADSNWRVDLLPAFAAAAAVGARTPWEAPAPRVWRYRGRSVWFATGAGGGEVHVEIDGVASGAYPSLSLALAAAKAEGWVPAEGLGRKELRERLGVPMHPLRFTEGQPKMSYLGGLPRTGGKWPTNAAGTPLGHLLQVALPEALVDGMVGLSVFFPTKGPMAADAGVAVLYDRPGFAMPSLQPPPGVVALPPAKIKVRKAQMERNHLAIDALPPDPALVALVEGLGLKAPGGDKLGGTPEWVDGAALPATARLVLQLDLDSIAWTKKQRKTWPDAALYGELYVFLGEEGPIVVWQNA